MAVTAKNSVPCLNCGKNLPISNYIKSKTNAVGVVPICRGCLQELSLENGVFDQKKVFDICRRADKPFFYNTFANTRDKSIPENTKIAEYMRVINVGKTSTMTFADGEPTIRNDGAGGTLTEEELERCIELFGEGFTSEEYKSAKRLFEKMTNNYPLKTNMHEQILADWAMTKTKEVRAMANGNVEEAEKWGKRADAKATAAKLNPSQLSAADLSEGINNFSKLTEAVERAVDIIPVLNTYRERPQDKVDYTIWQFINYCRKLEGKPPVEYREIYSFLDEQYEKHKELLKWLRREKDGHYDEVQ